MTILSIGVRMEPPKGIIKMANLPKFPKLRMAHARWDKKDGINMLHLQDDLSLASTGVQVPEHLVPLLELCDGTRSVPAINGGLIFRGVMIGQPAVENLLTQLDDALLIQNGQFKNVKAKATKSFRALKARKMAHGGSVYPSNPIALNEYFESEKKRHKTEPSVNAVDGASLRAVISPHIDYRRGAATYAKLWSNAAEHMDDIEQVITLGTDHKGSANSVTFTYQNYMTPFGMVRTDREAVKKQTDYLSTSNPLEDELHHRDEHSIELALNWFVHALGRADILHLPVLCGSLHQYIESDSRPADDALFQKVVESLTDYVSKRPTLVIAAGDFSHMGPAFDPRGALANEELAQIEDSDEESLSLVETGNIDAFFDLSSKEKDERKLCGLSPIYLMGKILDIDNWYGITVDYQQCPADEAGTSIVSIAGTLIFGK